MTTRKPFRADAKAAVHTNADGTKSEVVRLFGGTRSFAVDYTEIPDLINKLEQLQREQFDRDKWVDGLVME